MKKNGRTYEDMTHIYGRIWILCALGMIFAYPIVTCIYYQAWPGWKPVLKGLLGVAPIFWTVGLIEVVTAGDRRVLSGFCHRESDKPEGPGSTHCHGECQGKTGNREG